MHPIPIQPSDMIHHSTLTGSISQIPKSRSTLTRSISWIHKSRRLLAPNAPVLLWGPCQVVHHAIAPDAYPAACFVQDMDGKTLLILVCNSSCALFENDCQETIWDPPSIKLIWTFIKAYPTSLLLEDNDGTSALKHAILSEVSIEVVKVLQHAPAFMCARTGD